MIQASSNPAGSQLVISSTKYWEWGITLPAFLTANKIIKLGINLISLILYRESVSIVKIMFRFVALCTVDIKKEPKNRLGQLRLYLRNMIFHDTTLNIYYIFYIRIYVGKKGIYKMLYQL